ncbi:MAG TPA: MFS transporter [Tepidisphaeraceae bacterium]|jgi:MFS family permease
MRNVGLKLNRGSGSSHAISGPALRNALAVTTLAWVFGNVWNLTVTGAPFTLFARAIGASPFEMGLLAAIPYLAALVSLPASVLIERTGARKTIFFWGVYFQRGLWLIVGIAPLWLVSRYGMAAAPVALSLFIPLFFLSHAGNAVGGPAWVSWMADVVPARIRGKYFARRRMWALLLAVPAAWFVGWFLDRVLDGHSGAQPLATMRWCAILFACAAVFGLVDPAMFHVVPAVPKAPQRGAGLLRAMAGPLKDRQYLWFAGFAGTLWFAVVPLQQQFYQWFLIDRVGLSNRAVQVMVLVLPSLAQLVVLPVWGRACDRMGKRPLLIVATLGLVPVGLGWCLVGSGNLWLGYVMMVLGTALWTGVDIVNFNFVIEMSGSRGGARSRAGGTAYHAVNSVILNAAAFAGGLAWGGLAQWLKDWNWTPVAGGKTFTSFDVLFALSGVLRLGTVVVFLPRMREPAARGTRETLRFMGASMFANIWTALSHPIRFVRARNRQADVTAPMPAPEPAPAPEPRPIRRAA